MNGDVKAHPPRRTRAEQQAATRAALVAAAAEVLAERGFHGTSVEEVTARAGFTRGAFYSNFRDKEDLVGAVLDARAEVDVAGVAPLVAAAATPADLVASLRRTAKTGARSDPTWRRTVAELRLHALRSPALRERLAAWEAEQRAEYRTAVEVVLERAGIALPADADLIALIVQVLDDGIALHRDIEGEAIPPEAFFDALALLLRAAAALGDGPAVAPPP